MNRKKMIRNIALIAAIIGFGVAMPYGIRFITAVLSRQIEKTGVADELGTEEETEKEGDVRLSLEEEETEIIRKQENAGTQAGTAELDAPQTRASLAGLRQYHSMNTPEVKALSQEDLKSFVGDRNQPFVDAVLNYMYAYWQDTYEVKEIKLLDLVEDKDDKVTYQLQLTLTDGKKTGTALFLCSYDQPNDTYTMYKMRNATISAE